MPRVYVSIGSNIDREQHVPAAVRALWKRFGELLVSRVYESPAVGFAGPPFYNLVVGFDTDERPEAIAEDLRAIEIRAGRQRQTDKFAPRTLDLDLLLYGERVSRVNGLELPRDEILRYAFVLAPLAELAGSHRHPVTGERFADLWARFDRLSQPLRPVCLALR
jgi:2-amino-4-hydroxy-6-hydroxymethyldihydropteridine diphosphokinase